MSDRDQGPSPPLTPPSAPPPESGTGSGGNLRWLLAGGILLVLLAAGVFWGLPKLTEPPGAPGEQTGEEPSGQPDSQPVSESAVERQKIKREAEAVLEQALERQAALEEDDVSVWAPADFEAATDRLAEGDARFEQGDYRGAKTAYAAAKKRLEAIAQSRPQRLENALAKGKKALKANRVDAAIEQYKIAAALAPDNEEAATGLKRAQKRDAVLEHMETGRRHLEDDALAEARTAFQKASELDPAYTPAREAVERVTTAIRERRYSRAMSRFTAALDSQEFAAAEEALGRAREIKPEAEAVARAQKRLERERRQARLSNLRDRVDKLTANANWAEAVETYRTALEIDPNAAFAAQGLPRAQRRAEMDEAFQRYLSDPTRLYSKEPRQRAEALLEQSGRIEDPGPKLRRQREALAEKLEAAQNPETVTLVSDGKTRVTLYKVGELGRFQERRLELLPGDYVAVGSREGYRDVRREFRVRPGEAPEEVIVICKETV